MNVFRLLINGELVDGATSSPVLNPATEKAVADCPRGSPAQLDEAVAAASAAFPTWASTSLDGRKAVVGRVADAIEANGHELARLLTQEQGKPIKDATEEVFGMAAFFRYFTGIEMPVKVIDDSEGRRVEVHRRPLGVIGAIVPWNFPLLLLGFKLSPALIAGNTVVLKPSPTTPLTALKLGEIIKEIVPPGVVNVIADDNDLGALLTAHRDVRKISFTGSTATGSKVMAGAADLLKRVTLELGGNDAGIVLADVDPKEVAPKIFQSAFANNGQVCIAMKRLYVHSSIYDEMCAELAALADDAVLGNGLEQGTQLGPLQNRMQYEKVRELIESAKIDGKVITGGEVLDQVGYFIRPTIVRDVADGSRIVDEEQFGPILPVIKFDDPEDAVIRANASDYGLGGSVWSSNVGHAYELAEKMDAGTVWINKHLELDPAIPFGGAKQSGLGTELGEEGLKEFTQLKVINIAR